MRLLTLLFSVLLSTTLFAQEFSDIARATAMADAGDRHSAIALYESVLARHPEYEKQIVPRLARTYLWSDQPEKSLLLFRRALAQYPADCELHLDYATALSWSDHLRQALSEYHDIAIICPKYNSQALLGGARVLRWMDKLHRSDEIYAQLLADPKSKSAAEIGQVLNLQAEDRYRASRALAEKLVSDGVKDEALYIAEAGDDVRLGNSNSALDAIDATPQAFASNRQLTDLRDFLERRDNPSIDTHSLVFHDRDGTSYVSSENSFRAANRDGSFTVGQGISRLFGDTVQSAEGDVVGDWTSVSADHRFNETLFLSARATDTRFQNVGFAPITGELNAVITPADLLRIDLSAARILVADNYQALAHHLDGTFVSAGADIPVANDWTVTGAIDYTHWNEGNNRIRYRFRPAYRIEGRPRITVSLPVLFQTYDRPFSFNLFSPRRYTEIGPAVNVFIRKWHYWNFSAYGQAGVQHQSDTDWMMMGQVRAHADRDLWRHWATSFSIGWSNSNIASPSGFERFSVDAGLTYRFGSEKQRW